MCGRHALSAAIATLVQTCCFTNFMIIRGGMGVPAPHPFIRSTPYVHTCRLPDPRDGGLILMAALHAFNQHFFQCGVRERGQRDGLEGLGR